MAHKRKDILWKGAVDEFVIDLLHFFYPNADELFDFSKPIVFLDPELAQLFPDRENMRDSIVSDRLLQVPWLNGGSVYIYLLLEVHDYHKKAINYNKRIFHGFARLFDKYEDGVMALVIYTGTNNVFTPGIFEYTLNNMRLHFSYDVYRVIDQDEDNLRQSDNLFAIFIRTVLLSMKKGKVGNDLLIDLHVDLAKEVASLGIAQDKINELLQFIALYINFGDQEINRTLENRINSITVKTESMNLYEAAVLVKTEEAREEKSIAFVKKLLLKGDYTVEEIADLAEVSVDFVQQIRDQLKSK